MSEALRKRSIKALFTEHPASVGETYLEHMGVAASVGGRLLAAAGACLVHALFPFLFEKTGSRMISELYSRTVVNRDARVRTDSELSGNPTR